MIELMHIAVTTADTNSTIAHTLLLHWPHNCTHDLHNFPHIALTTADTWVVRAGVVRAAVLRVRNVRS